MANTNAIARTDAAAGNRQVPAACGGEVRVVQDKVVINALPQNDTVTFGGALIPKGATIVDAYLTHVSLGASTTVSLDIGSRTYIASSNGNSAGRTYSLADDQGEELDEDAYPVMTLGGAAASAGDKDIVCTVYFTCY